MGFLDRLKEKITGKKDQSKYLSGFSKTSSTFGKKLKFISKDGTKIEGDFLEELMVTLIESDLGYKTSDKIVDLFYKKSKKEHYKTQDEIIDGIIETFKDLYLFKEDTPIQYNENGPTVILIVGVNGSGKTSTCAKLAKKYKDEGKKVCLVAADTFRAGAIEQLRRWASQVDVDFVAGEENRDPSSVLVDGCRYAKENNIDILICDTAGRLQNKVNLMNELAKMFKVVKREIEGAPHNTWLVLDANTGQNGLSQAELFNSATNLTGIILTKMDGTSKGGIVIAIKDTVGVPVRFMTFGETMDDLKEFDLDLYLYSIIGDLNDD